MPDRFPRHEIHDDARPPAGPNRRALLSAGGAALGLALLPAPRAGAQNRLLPPILFVHGNGDDAALWMTTFWRFESNGWPRDRLAAVNFTDPLARNDNRMAQNGRSAAEDQKRELAAAIEAFRSQHGVARIAVVAHGRGGLTLRDLMRDSAEAAKISHAVLCGVPNGGIFDWERDIGSLFNARGAYMQSLNGAQPLIPAGVAVLTLRSDGYDKYAQPDGRFMDWPGVPTGIGRDSPMLEGASNVLLGPLDYRELAFSAPAFREMFRFIAGQEPARIAITPESEVVLDGLVTGNPGGLATNRPVADATVEIYRTDPETGLRQGETLLQKITGLDGRWGPLRVRPDWSLEFVITAPGNPATHLYRAPFPRSSAICHLRAARPLDRIDQAAGAVLLMVRPRGFFGIPRDIVLFDGRVPDDITSGVPTDAISELRLPMEGNLNRPIVALFNRQRVVARAWAVAERRISVAELTY